MMGDRLKTSTGCVFLLVAVCVASTAVLHAADLRPNTAIAFDRYVRLTELRLDDERRAAAPFLWVETLPGPQKQEVERQLQRGDVVIRRLETKDGGRSVDIPGGLCHHWIGTVFIQHAKLDRVIALMQGYDNYHEIYRPAIRQSRLVSRDGDHFVVSLQLFMKKVVSVVLNTQNDVRYLRLSATRAQVRSTATRIAEVDDPDSGDEREKPVGHDNGFLWRFNNYCALEERDGGTYVQCESVSLSRSIPVGLGWLVGPFVSSVPQQSLEFTLTTMRNALIAS
jgi:hypothetical protein